jgi:hypothetical protein
MEVKKNHRKLTIFQKFNGALTEDKIITRVLLIYKICMIKVKENESDLNCPLSNHINGAVNVTTF